MKNIHHGGYLTLDGSDKLKANGTREDYTTAWVMEFDNATNTVRFRQPRKASDQFMPKKYYQLL